MPKLNFEERAKGALTGAVIGSELAFARCVHPERFSVEDPREVFNIKIETTSDYKEEPWRAQMRTFVPFVELGVKSYLSRNGRALPEDFADVLKNSEEIAAPLIAWDTIHTIQEILNEGMNPRLSGLGATPSGLICAAMPSVGIYHAADPEYAYLDGVELASVVQPRIGADWAGLCAAAVAAAFVDNAGPSEMVENVMKIAFRNNKELFYQLSSRVNYVRGFFKSDKSEAEFLKWWHCSGGLADFSTTSGFTFFDPVYYFLPLLEHYSNDAGKLMALLLIPGGFSVAPIVAGAVLGAFHGVDIFPPDWSKCAEPAAGKLFPVINVVKERLRKEKEIIAATEKLNEKEEGRESVLLDKVYGCLLASSIGNAMGSPVEGRFYWEIDKNFQDGIKTVMEPSRLESEDDNQMAMLLVETYVERNGLPVTARHFGETWNKHLNRHNFYPQCMGSACDMIRAGWDPRITGHWKPVTGSTVMCMEPVGIYHLLDQEFAMTDAIEISYMYQRGLDVTATAILVAAVVEAFRDGATVESICRAAVDAAPDMQFRTFDKRPYASPRAYLKACLEVAEKYDDVIAARKELYEKCLFYHWIDPLEALGLALAMFKIARGDVRQASIGGTNIGRDSDTIAGRAAMLSGILKGAKGVPDDWLALFKSESIDRIKHNAEKMVKLITKKKLERMKERQKI